jgi:hypothetical protein
MCDCRDHAAAAAIAVCNLVLMFNVGAPVFRQRARGQRLAVEVKSAGTEVEAPTKHARARACARVCVQKSSLYGVRGQDAVQREDYTRGPEVRRGIKAGSYV